MGTSPDELRARIEQTRAELAGDVDRLADRTSPRRVVQRRKERMRTAVTGLRDRVMGSASGGSHQGGGQVRHMQERTQEAGMHAAHTARDSAGQAADTISDAAGQAGHAVQAAPERAMRQTAGNPLAAGLIAFGLGALAASMLPATRAEERAADRLSEHADLAEPVREAAVESVQRVKEDAAESARQAAREVKETAAGAARTTGAEARDQAGQVKDQARGSGGDTAAGTSSYTPGSLR